MPVAIKRAYEKPASADGTRVLVDRLWPRGISKQRGRIDAWLRDLAPSDALRKWFGHRAEYFGAFRKRYMKELSSPEALRALEQLHQFALNSRQLTLVYSAKD